MKTKSSISRKRREAAQAAKALRLARGVFRSIERSMRTPPRPRKIDPEVAKRALEHALKLISLHGPDAVLFLQERDASVAVN